MTDDTKKILEDLEKRLQEDELLMDMPESILEEPDEQSVSQVLDQLMTEPAFEDPDQMSVAQGDVEAYHNYSNDYGQEQQYDDVDMDMEQEYGVEEKPERTVNKQDLLQIILMAIASFLCLGIIGVLIYWIETFLS